MSIASSMDAAIFKARVAKCRNWMRQNDADLLVLFPSPNMFYLAGFSENPAERLLVLLITQTCDPVFVVPEMYGDHIGRDSWVQDIRTWKDGEDPNRLLAGTIAETAPDPKRILVDDQMWALFFLPLQQVCGNANFELASVVLNQMRMRKDAAEVDLLKKAGAIADQTFEWICDQPFEGRAETEIATSLASRMKALGGEDIAFDILVASGPNGALPHHSAGTRKVQRGDVVIMDYGCRVGGYHSDITRTVVCGQADDEAKKVYEVVKQAQAEGVRACQPQVVAQSIDVTTRSIITEAGYGDYFIHRTGHGLGLEVHEAPYIVVGDDTTLEPGMSFSVEPGIYLPGKFGVRIEDIVVITDDGVESFNQCTRELQIVN